MRRWRAKDVVGLADENALLVRKALERAQSDKHSGFGSGGGDGRGTLNASGSAHSRTESLAISGQVSSDDVRSTLKALVAALGRTHKLASELVGIPDSEAQKLLLPAGAGWCENQACQRFCPGGPDRLRSGRCNRCRMYRVRHAGEEWKPEEMEEAG